MKKETMIVFGCLIFVGFILGCTGGGGEVNETKLEENEGIGIVGNLKIEELNPGLDGYIFITVRNNLGGENAGDIIVGLDNVKPFKIVECGGLQEPDDKRNEVSNCVGQFNLDRILPFRQHGTSKMFPGEETEIFWRLRAPSADEISDIALEHPVYYDLEYSYKTSFTQNIIFMSQQEVIRRRQSGEEYVVEGEAKSGAGELRVSATTQQPILYFFSKEMGADEDPFSFALQYNVENKGQGIPLSDVVVLFELPHDISTLGGVSPQGIKANDHEDEDNDNQPVMETYGWYKWNEWRTNSGICRTGRTDPNNPKIEYTQACSDWIVHTYGGQQEFDSRFKALADNNLLVVKVVKREDFVDSFDIFVPLEIEGQEINDLKNYNIPIKISTFKVHTMYRYFTEGKDYITVYPIRI